MVGQKGKAKRPRVSVLLVSRNGAKFLPRCLASLKSQRFKDFELVFVDNASTDGSWRLARRSFPRCTLVRNKAGRGFCGGNNQGYALCRGEYVLLLNNDVILPPDVLELLVKKMDSDGKIAIVGASQYPFGSGLSAKPIMGIFHFLSEGASTESDRDLDAFAVLSCGLVRRSAFPGRLFDPIYGTGGEDVFICLDALCRGLRVVQSAHARFWHHGASRRGWEPDRFCNYERTGWINYLRFFSARTLLLMMPVVAIEWALRTGLSILSLRFDKLWLRTKAQLWILANLGLVLEARRRSLAAKRVRDSVILGIFTGNRINLAFLTTWRYLAYQKYIDVLMRCGLIE